MEELIVGIDLGTTNSEIAVVKDGQPVVLSEEGDPILPSFVGLSADGKLLVGRAARNQWVIAPERTIKSIKRKMGEDVAVPLGDQSYSPPEVSAMILRALKDRASRALGVEVSKAVITVPAFFNDTQRQATKAAGAIAGLDVVRILNEPTAASLCYDTGSSDLVRTLVFDLGGGTFDVSVVQSQQGVVEVLASHGDTKLGGDDFDEALLNLVADGFLAEHGVDLRQNLVSKARLLQAVEAAKRQLSDHPFARIEEEFIAEKDGVSLHLTRELSRAEFETLIRPWLERTRTCVEQSLTDAKLTPRQIDKVVLVGGSTRTPLVQAMLAEQLGQAPQCSVNPDLCVAMGAALQAAIIAGQSIGSVLVDITPHSLGIRAIDYSDAAGSFGMPFGYRFAPIIHRNTALPASRSDVFHTLVDNQPTVKIDIYQGENPDVRRNHCVGAFQIEGLARVPEGNEILVQFDLDLSGMLRVSAKEKATGLQKQITISNALTVPAETDESRERLEQIWQESQMMGLPAGIEEWADEDEAIENEEPAIPELVPAPRSGQRETVQAKALLEKAERVRPKISPEDQVELDQVMAKVRTSLDDRKWTELESAMTQLSDVLFYLEDQ